MRILAWLLLVMVIALPASAASVPQWTGHYVNDYAGVLGNGALLEAMLQDIERNSTVEFAVVTVSSIPTDETKETYAYKILNGWGIGKKSEDNGMLFLLIANGTPGNRMRLEIGYGLEGYITDAGAGRILDAAMPYYESGDYSQASYEVVSGVKTLLENKEYSSGYKASRIKTIVSILPFIFMFFIFVSFIAAFMMRPKCPDCGSKDMRSDGMYIICRKCGKKIRRPHNYVAPVFIAGGGLGGAGGFGGGGGGGGGAGR